MLRIWPFARQRRDIFHYYDGVKRRSGDPMVLYRGLATHKDLNLAEDVARLFDANDAAIESHERLTQAVREVFGVPAYGDNQPGLTERETIDLFWQFADFIDDLKKNSNPLPTPPPATAPTSSSSSAEANPATSATSDSTST